MDYHKTIDGSNVIIRDTSSLYEVVYETMEIVVDRHTGLTQRGGIDLEYLEHNVTLSGRVMWQGHHITGTYNVNQQGKNEEELLTINTHKHVLGRGAIFGLIPALPIATNQVYSMNLFAFTSGEVWEMTLSVGEKKMIDWRGNSVEVFPMQLVGGKIENTIYMATDGTGRLYQIDVVGQDMHIVLQ